MNWAPKSLASDLQVVLDQYDLGDLVDYRRDLRGTVNTNFVIVVEEGGIRNKYFLRCYKESVLPVEIVFEHSLIRHLISQGFSIVARVHSTRSGNTYLKHKSENDPQTRYFAVYDYLPGEDKYTWISPRCTLQEIRSAAQTLAQFHAAVKDFIPSGYRCEPVIIDLLPGILEFIRGSEKISKKSEFDRYLYTHREFLTAQIENITHILRNNLPSGLPKIVIHCDYHPGNLKFQSEKVVGLVDFDWSKMDLRVFDVGLAIWYFFTEWSPDFDGSLRMDEVSVFLSAYQGYLKENDMIPPLMSAELEFLPVFIQAANFYVLNWALQDYHKKTVDAKEYLIYLRHGVNFSRWCQDKNLFDLINLSLRA